MQCLWSKNEVCKKHDLTLRLCSRQRGGATTKSNIIRINIWDFNYQKSLCVQQNNLLIMWNFLAEKKVPHFFLKWAFVVLLVLPQKCAFTIAKHTKIRLFRQDFGNLLKMQWHAASSDFCMHCPSSRSGLLYDTWNLLLWNWEHIFGCLIRQLIRSSTTACICFLESRNTKQFFRAS